MRLPSLYIECSEEQAAINDALAKSQATFGPVVKDENGPFGKFASLNSMIAATRPSLTAQGLSVIQSPQPIMVGSARMWCVTELRHKSGQWIRSAVESLIHDNPQKTLSNFSYMRRLAYGGLLCLASNEDRDGAGLAKETENKTVLMAKQKIQSAKSVKEMETITARISQLHSEGGLHQQDAEVLMDQATSKMRALQDRAKKKEKANAN